MRPSRVLAALVLGASVFGAGGCVPKGGAAKSGGSVELSAPERARFGRLKADKPPERVPYATYRPPAGKGGGPGGLDGDLDEAVEAASRSGGELFDGSRPRAPGAPLPAITGLPSGRDSGASFRRSRSDARKVVVRTADIPGAGRALIFESGMAIDTDGPIADKALARRVRANDPNHQEETSYRYADYKSLDPSRVPYIVLPLDYPGAEMGDLAVVQYEGKSVLAVCGDRGPAPHLGEASLKTAAALGIDTKDGRVGTSGPVTYVVFPGSGKGKHKDEAALLEFIQTEGRRRYDALKASASTLARR